MDNARNIAENRLKVVLAEQNKTSRWLAKELGKSENTISRWCLNKVQPSLQQLNDIAVLLGIDVRTLLKPTNESK